MTKLGPVGSQNRIYYDVYRTSRISGWCPSGVKAKKTQKRKEDMRRKTGTLVDPQTGELATKYMGFDTRKRCGIKL